MATPTVNVVRYTALAAGIFYGIAHRRTLQKQKNEQRAHEAVHQREELIHRAKEAWKRQSEQKKDDLVTNPDDPNFDIEKLLQKWEKEYQ
ncbi:TIM11 [Sanghuangporus weigelae]